MLAQGVGWVASGARLRGLGTGLLLLAAVGLGKPAEEASPDEAQAALALKKLQGRIPGRLSDLPGLRRDLLDFRVKYPGTQASLRAAALLAELPSPLDRLSATTIAALEKFDNQPKELVGVLGEHRGRHGGAVGGVAFSGDGNLIASGGSAYVRLWSPVTMRLLSTGGHGANVTAVAFTPDSKVLVSGNIYGTLMVWEVVKGQTLRHKGTVSAATSTIYSLACHPNNKIVAAACFDNVVRLYDISGATVRDAGQVDGHTKAVYAVAYSPDGKTLATGSEDLTARLWSVPADGPYKEVSRIENHTAAVRSVAFASSGKTLATGCADGTVRFWSVPGSPKPKLPRISFAGPKGAVTSLAFSKSGQTLAANGGDGIVRLWNVATGKVRERFRLDGHKGVVNSVAYSPDMKLLVSGSDDWTVRTWDLMAKKAPVERFVPWSHLSHIYALAFSPDGQTLATGSYDRVVRFWDLARTEPRTRNYLKGDDVPVYAVAYSPDGKLVAAAGQATRIRQWDAAKGTTKPHLGGHAGWIYKIEYSPDGKYLLSASGKVAHLFDVAKGAEVKRFTKHETMIHCHAFSPDTKRILTGSGYYLYDKMNKIVIKDGKYVYTDCVLRMWDLEKGEELAAIKEATTPFYSTSFAADGRHIYGGNYEAMLRRWTLEGTKLSEESPLKGSYGYVYGVVPTPDGKQVITLGSDYRVIVWDLASGKRVREWTFTEQLGGIALAHDSRHLAVGLGTGVIYVLRLGEAVAKPK
jgi:WD40 repeat protein